MTVPLLARLRGGVANLRDAYIVLGRLHAIRNLDAGALTGIVDAAKSFCCCLDAASQIHQFGRRYYNLGECFVAWPKAIHPGVIGILGDKKCHTDILSDAVDHAGRTVQMCVRQLRELTDQTLLSAPLVILLNQLDLPLTGARDDRWHPSDLLIEDAPRTATKSVDGPVHVHMDPCFIPSYSLLEYSPPAFGDTVVQNLPYFWTMANRECLASQLCALSAVEYDGLPLAFYVDAGKQCWDEARHALFCLETTRRLEQESRSWSLEGVPAVFRDGYSGLGKYPVPREGNFFETFYNADLTERLILMNYMTEAPAVATITQRLSLPFCTESPAVAEFFHFDRADEASHAEIGNRWLRFMIPDDEKRARLIEDAELLRGLLILTTFSHHGGGDLNTLIEHYLRVESSPRVAARG